MRLGILCLALAAVVLGLAGVTGAAGGAAFSDPVGDSGIAPDLTSVTVSNDDQGLITFRITVANRTTLGLDDAIAIPFATNTPGRAGLRDDGANFVLGLEGKRVFLNRWTGSIMLEIGPRSLRGSFTGGILTLSVRQDDLAPGFPSPALPTELSFYVGAFAFDGNKVLAEDNSPDASDQFWSYRLVQPPRLVVTYLRAAMEPRAGTTLAVRLAAAWSDTGRAARPTKVSCRAKLGDHPLKATSRTAAEAICSWALPKKSRGKTLRGSITLMSGGSAVTRSFSRRVR